MERRSLRQFATWRRALLTVVALIVSGCASQLHAPELPKTHVAKISAIDTEIRLLVVKGHPTDDRLTVGMLPGVALKGEPK